MLRAFLRSIGIKGMLRRAGLLDRDPFTGFLRDAAGVIHVGAHTGQERNIYEQYRLRVLWIEPLPELFAILKQNLDGYRSQIPVQSLITDTDDGEYLFHVTSNAGASSSIFPLGKHKDVWPDVTHMKTISLTSKTLPTLLAVEKIEASNYDALVLDTQGSELLVLKGAERILHRFKFIKAEAATFAAYEGCCQLSEIETYLAERGFEEIARKLIASHPHGGAYFDVVYRRRLSTDSPR